MAGGTKIYYIAGLDQTHVGATVFNITADSEPVLDGWGWADYWSCNDWIYWHKLNVQKYGKEEANRKFLQWWEKQDGTSGPYNWCKYDSDITAYLKSQGLNIGWWFSNAANTATDTVEKTADSAGSVVQSVGSGASGLAKLVKYAAPVAGALLLAGLAYYSYKKYLK